MRKHWRYLVYLARHKWYVFVAGLRLDVPLWRLIVHDWSKFLPSEWVGYVDNFYAERPDGVAHAWYQREMARLHRLFVPIPPDVHERVLREEQDRKAALTSRRKDRYDRAWLKHQNRHPHHWQYWVLMEDRPPEGTHRFRALPMPEVFIREMVADWLGAGRAITGGWDVWKWYFGNKHNQVMHPYVRHRVEELLAWYRPAFQPGSDRILYNPARDL